MVQIVVMGNMGSFRTSQLYKKATAIERWNTNHALIGSREQYIMQSVRKTFRYGHVRDLNVLDRKRNVVASHHFLGSVALP